MFESSLIPLQAYLQGLDPNESMTIYVMPKVNVKIEVKDPFSLKSYERYSEELLVSFIKNEVIMFARVVGNELGNPSDLRPGQKIVMYGSTEGEIHSKYVPIWKVGGNFNGTDFCFGQSILISAAPGGGKTTATAGLARSFESKPNTASYRMLIGERMDDKLYFNSEEDKTIHCDSSAPIEVQLKVVYETLTEALRDAYNGVNVILVIDSLTRMMSSLTGLHSDSHMESGGVAFDVKVMVANLFRLAGGYGDGTLTIIATCFYSNSNNTWKNIYTELSAAANGEIQVARSSRNKSLVESSSRRREIKVYPYFTLFGKKIYY